MDKSILDIWHNRGKIFEGFMNTIFKKEDVEIIAAERMKICNDCPNLDKEGSKCFAPGTQPCCSLCGCKLAFKTRSLSSYCDDNRWHAVLIPDEEIQVNEKLGYNPDDNQLKIQLNVQPTSI